MKPFERGRNLVGPCLALIGNFLFAQVLLPAEREPTTRIELGVAGPTDLAFDRSGKFVIAAAVEKDVLSVKLIQVDTGKIVDQFDEAGATGCKLVSHSSKDEYCIGFISTHPVNGTPKLTPEAILFKVEHGQFSRMTRKWRGPKGSFYCGFGGGSQFVAFYVPVEGEEAVLESLSADNAPAPVALFAPKAAPWPWMLYGYNSSTQRGVVGGLSSDRVQQREQLEIVATRADGKMHPVGSFPDILHADVSGDGNFLAVIERTGGTKRIALEESLTEIPLSGFEVPADAAAKDVQVSLSHSGRLVVCGHRDHYRVYDCMKRDWIDTFELKGPVKIDVSEQRYLLAAAKLDVDTRHRSIELIKLERDKKPEFQKAFGPQSMNRNRPNPQVASRTEVYFVVVSGATFGEIAKQSDEISEKSYVVMNVKGKIKHVPWNDIHLDPKALYVVGEITTLENITTLDVVVKGGELDGALIHTCDGLVASVEDRITRDRTCIFEVPVGSNVAEFDELDFEVVSMRTK